MAPTVQEPPITFANALVQLGILVNDADNFSFTADQKTQALLEAWHDGWVVGGVWDSSITYTPGTFQYALPSTVSAVSDVYIQRDTSQYPEPIANELWEIITLNGVLTLQLNEQARAALPDSFTLYLKGRYKLTVTDNLTTIPQINYVLSLAAVLLLRKLSYMKVFRFLRNDTTLADIINMRKQMEADVIYWRSQLPRGYESA